MEADWHIGQLTQLPLIWCDFIRTRNLVNRNFAVQMRFSISHKHNPCILLRFKRNAMYTFCATAKESSRTQFIGICVTLNGCMTAGTTKPTSPTPLCTNNGSITSSSDSSNTRREKKRRKRNGKEQEEAVQRQRRWTAKVNCNALGGWIYYAWKKWNLLANTTKKFSARKSIETGCPRSWAHLLDIAFNVYTGIL